MKIKVLHAVTEAEIQHLDLDHLICEGESCFIGRSPHSGIVLDSPSVSRLHGKLWQEAGQYYFCDLGSGNGSLIHGTTATVNQHYLLQPGTRIQVGNFVLLLEAAASSLSSSEDTGKPATVTPASLDAALDDALKETTSQLADEAHLKRSLAFAADAEAPLSAEDVVNSSVNFHTNTEDNTVETVIPEVVDTEVETEQINRESSALVKLEPALDATLYAHTKALFVALNRRVIAELRAARSLSRDAYLKAIQKARQSLEQERLIDPVQFEREAEKYWQSISRSTSQWSIRLGAATAQGAAALGNRLGAAARAAWHEFVTPRSTPNDADAPLPEPPQPPQSSKPDNQT